MYARRFILAAVVVAAFALSAQPQGGARLDQAHTRSAWVDGKRVDITPANLIGAGILERLRSALFVTHVDGGWAPYVESERTVSPPTYEIEDLDAPPALQPPPVTRGSGCWWLWVVTGMPAC